MNICKYFQNIQTVDYEDDLDLLYLSIVSQGEDGLQGKVNLHDNHTGQLIKEIPLTEHWKDVSYIYHSCVILHMLNIIKPTNT